MLIKGTLTTYGHIYWKIYSVYMLWNQYGEKNMQEETTKPSTNLQVKE